MVYWLSASKRKLKKISQRQPCFFN
jgi:hypothetical protein